MGTIAAEEGSSSSYEMGQGSIPSQGVEDPALLPTDSRGANKVTGSILAKAPTQTLLVGTCLHGMGGDVVINVETSLGLWIH